MYLLIHATNIYSNKKGWLTMKKLAAGTSNPLRKKNTAARLMKNLGMWVLLLPALLVMYFFTIRPIMTGVWYSLHDLQGYKIIGFCGLKNYQNIISDTRFLKVLWNSLQYVIWSLVIGYLPPIIVAIILNEMVHGKSFFKFAIYFPGMVPALAVSLLWYYMYLPDASGLLNTMLAHIGIGAQPWLQNEKLTIILITVAGTWGGFGGTAIMYLASLQGINNELYEAAALDGAGFFTRIRKITIPGISSIMLLFLVQQIIATFNILEQPLAMTGGGPNNASMSLGLWSYYNGFISFNTAASLATGVITFLILLVLTFFYFILKRKIEAE